MNSTMGAGKVAEAVERYFMAHEVASLRLPTHWFGRPYDNWHVLTEAATDGELVVVRLDEVQVLRLDAVGSTVKDRTLQIAVRSGLWSWTGYGGSDRHREQIGVGTVEPGSTEAHV